MNARVQACIGLGGNVGDVPATLDAALAALAALPATRVLRTSGYYVTPAWGGIEQPDFVNAAAVLDTALAPLDLLDGLLAIERRAGRDRNREVRWGPRTLDLDLLLYGDVVLDSPRLSLPHPRLHERAFALLPLAEVAPEARIPGMGTVRDALLRVDASGLRLLAR